MIRGISLYNSMEIQKYQFISDVKKYCGLNHSIITQLIELVIYDRQVVAPSEQLHLMECLRRSSEIIDSIDLLFTILDYDKDGYITKGQLCNFLVRFNYKFDPSDISKIFNELNGKQLKISDHLSRKEFLTFVAACQ